MSINLDKPHLWKSDIAKSVDLYNEWFMNFAPKTFRDMRILTAKKVEDALEKTNYFENLSACILEKYPEVVPILRMSTCPPIARDRLIGLSGVSRNLITSMENSDNPRIPPKMSKKRLYLDLQKVSNILRKMLDTDIFSWLIDNRKPTSTEIVRSSTIVADRLCGAFADPIIRNAQEKRQLDLIKAFLETKGYVYSDQDRCYEEMRSGTFSFHTNVRVYVANGHSEQVNISVDVVVLPKEGKLPIFLEAKSAGDFANVNKRRKEEAIKMQQLRYTYGEKVSYNLFLCGYFDSGYLGYEAAEGIDWIWEHRITDMNFLQI